MRTVLQHRQFGTQNTHEERPESAADREEDTPCTATITPVYRQSLNTSTGPAPVRATIAATIAAERTDCPAQTGQSPSLRPAPASISPKLSDSLAA